MIFCAPKAGQTCYRMCRTHQSPQENSSSPIANTRNGTVPSQRGSVGRIPRDSRDKYMGNFPTPITKPQGVHLIHQRLCEHGLINFVVTKAPVAHNIDHDVGMPLLPPVCRQLTCPANTAAANERALWCLTTLCHTCDAPVVDLGIPQQTPGPYDAKVLHAIAELLSSRSLSQACLTRLKVYMLMCALPRPKA